MPLKKTVAMERRIDLASLFCLIARHGPAVVLALVLLGCLLAGFVFCKNTREKWRRRARRAAAAAERRDSSAGHGDAALGLEEEEEAEEEPGRTTLSGSTDDSDESSQEDVREQCYPSHGHVRQRRTASERKPYKHKVPNRDTVIDKAQHAFFWEWNSHRTQSYAEESVQNLEKGNTHKLAEDVAQDIHGAKEEEKMPEADSSEDLSTTNEDVSEGEFRQEETVQFTFNSQSCSCPAPNLSVNDGEEITREINLKHLESDVKDDTAPILVKENISSGPHKDDKERKTIEQNVASSKSSCLNNEKHENRPCDEETISTTSSAEVKEEHLLIASQMGEAELSKLEETKDVVLSSNDVSFKPSHTTHITDSSLDGQQIDQSGHCPQEQTHHTIEVQTDKDLSTSQKDIEIVNNIEFPDATPGESINISIADAIPHSLDVNVAEYESVVRQETPEHFKIETADLANMDFPTVLQSQETATQVLDGNQTCTDSLCDMTEDQQQTTPVCKETDSNVVGCIEVKSVDSKEGECLAPPPPNQLTELLDEETSQSGLPADVMEEILSITDTTAPSNQQKEHETTQILDTETIPPGLDNERKQADTNEMSTAIINDKIECIVEQMVADAYKEVRKTSLELKSVRLEEKSLEQPSVVQQVQESFGFDHENLTSNAVEQDAGKVFKQESKEVDFCSKMAAKITEEVMSTVCSLELTNLKVRSESQKDIVTSCIGLDSFSQINIDSNNMSMVEPVIDAQEINQVEEENSDQETLKITGNEVSISSEDLNLIPTTAIEVKSLQTNENLTLEQTSVPPVPKMEGEILTGTETETFENLEPSMEKSQQNAPETLAESEVGNVSVAKEEDQPEIQPVIKMEILENTSTSNEGQRKEPELSLDANKDVSSSTEKVSRKVVIVCRTLESSVSAVEISDSEDDGETSHLELKSSGISTREDYLEDKATPANEECSVDVAASCDPLAAKTPVDETTAQETPNNSHLTSGSALDFSQDNATVMKPMEQIKLKDNGVSSSSLESGISSMTVSPEMEEACNEIDEIIEGDLPADFDPMLSSQNTTCKVSHAEENVSHSLFTSDGVNTVKEDAVSMDIVPLASSPVQRPALEDISNELLATNEDSFGSEIEKSYQKAMEEVMMEVVHNGKSISDDMTDKHKDKIDKKEQASAANKEEGEKADSEKTDISIMEATMDHNEWIIDGSYQVLPWMNATSSRDASSSKQGVDLVENKQTPSQTSTTEDSSDNAKKVLAVQPMPQNVNVTFRVHYLPLSPYQTVAVTGDQQELGAWKSVVPLEKTKDGYWSCVVGLPAESHVEWKFVVLDKGEVCRWEECGNRLLHTGLADDLLVHKWWGIL